MVKKMKTKTVLVCEGCDAPILREAEGFLIVGSIGPADPGKPPLIGEPLPSKATLAAKEVAVTALCRSCFGARLGLTAAVVGPSSMGVPDGPGAPAPSPGPSAPVVPNGAKVTHAGSGLPNGNVETLPALPGPVRVGDTVRVTPRHRFYAKLRGRAARVERFREDSGDFVLVFASGQPMIGTPSELEKIA